MKIPVSIAKKLLLLKAEEMISASQLKHESIQKMVEDGVLGVKTEGRSRKKYFLRQKDLFHDYLHHQFGIVDLNEYIQAVEQKNSRSELIKTSSSSKTNSIRTFKGFLVNSFTPIETQLNGKPWIIQPPEGSFQYVFDYEHFSILKEVVIVGIENAENFRYIQQQRRLFPSDKNYLFVSRYPQSKDLVSWLKTIPNTYLHFGDFDFAGIRIFISEFEKHLGNRAQFYIPDHLEEMLQQYGNSLLYNKQFQMEIKEIDVPELNELYRLFHQYNKCLEQEVFIEFN